MIAVMDTKGESEVLKRECHKKGLYYNMLEIY